jgi:hypothetical protein
LRGILYRSIIALSYLISILYSGLKLGGEPNKLSCFTPNSLRRLAKSRDATCLDNSIRVT